MTRALATLILALALTASGMAFAQPSLLPLAQPLWSELNQSQRDVLNPFEKQWNSLPLNEKRAWVKLANDFPRMAPALQLKAKKRMNEWASLTPAQRKLARDNFRLAKAVPKQEQAKEFENYRSMTTEQRRVLRTAGTTSNTAAVHAGATTGLAKEAAQPIPATRPGRPALTVPPPSAAITNGQPATIRR